MLAFLYFFFFFFLNRYFSILYLNFDLFFEWILNFHTQKKKRKKKRLELGREQSLTVKDNNTSGPRQLVDQWKTAVLEWESERWAYWALYNSKVNEEIEREGGPLEGTVSTWGNTYSTIASSHSIIGRLVFQIAPIL